jgi:hypothetical protein
MNYLAPIRLSNIVKNNMMKNIIIKSMIAGGIALVVSSCSTGQMAVESASNDDVYNSNVQARTITYAARTTNNYADSGSDEQNQTYYDESYDSRLSIDNRNPITWRDNYYNNYLAYDPFYFDPFYNNWYSPGFSVGLGWNSWGGNSWSLGWNNWGWNNWGWNNWGWNSMAYNPWYSPYHSPFWGPYSYYGGFGRPFYGGYYGGGYWGGGYWGGGVIARNPGVARPDRGTGRVSSARPGTSSTGSRSSVSRIPRPTANTRPSATSRPSGVSGTDRNSVGTSQSTRPSRTGTSTQQRPTRTETQQRPTRTESSGNRPSIERSSPQPSYTPSRPSSGGSSGGGGGRSSSGGGGRPSR